MSWLVTAALFAAALIALLMHRIGRDAGGRADTRYFQRVGWVFTAGLISLACGMLAGLPPRHPFILLSGMSSSYLSVYMLALFASSFPHNTVPPLSLRVWLGALTAALIVATARGSFIDAAGPFVMTASMVPYFGLTLYFLHRNWKAATAPGARSPSTPVTIVQAAVLVPWVASFLAYAVLARGIPRPLPTWIYLAQALGMSLAIVGGVAVAILRYHLFEIRVLLGEAVLAVIATGAFAIYVGVAAAPLQAWLDAAVSPGFAALVVVGVPPFVVHAAISVLDRWMTGMPGSITGAQSERTLLERTLAVTGRMVDPDAILAVVVAALDEATHGTVRFLRGSARALTVSQSPAPAPLLDAAAESTSAFWSSEHRPELPAALSAWMDASDARLVVPVRRSDALYGFLVVYTVPRVPRPSALLCARLGEHLALKFENFALYADAALAARELADYRVRLGRELEESRRLASLGAFAAAIAHDIRTPLTSIQMNVQILRARAQLSEADREYLDIAQEEIARLTRSVGEILEFARPLSLCAAPEDLREVADDIARSVQALYAERGVTLRVVHEGEGPWTVSVDEARLRKALLNLLDNAVDASARGQTVTLRTTATPEGPRLRVEDSGRGIAPEDLSRVFDPFFTTRPDGTGLGLAIAQKIVRAHGGEITVESAPGEGSRFTITLPARHAAP